MALLEGAIANIKAKKTSGIKIYRLEENNINIGITKYMDAVAEKYLKNVKVLANEEWNDLDDDEKETAGSVEEIIEEIAFDEIGWKKRIGELEKSLRQAVKRQLK